VLIDTTGRSPRDARVLDAMGRQLAGPQTYLVASATTAEGVLDQIAAGFGKLTPRALVATKLDETTQPAPILEFAVRSQLPVTFLCDGQDLAGHLHRPTPDHFADLFLRGRLA
jgi:flagellar biosynthesis protein FlhF